MALTSEQFEQLKTKLQTSKTSGASAPSLDGFSAASFLKGAAKGAIDTTVQTARMLQGGGQRVLAGLDPTKTVKDVQQTTGFKSLGGNEAKQIDENLESKNKSETAGKVTETIAEFLLPFLSTEKVTSAIGKASGAVEDLTTKVGQKLTTNGEGVASKTAKAVLGEKDAEIVKSAQNPVAKLFKSGERKVQDVVTNIEKGVSTFEEGSKKALQAVKDSIPEIAVKPQAIAEKVNQGIMNSLQHSADYKGLKQGFETVDDIVNSGILKPEESERIKKVVEFIGKWKDNSARGVLNLKESLGNFYATGENYTGSNAVVRSIQRNLVDLVGEYAPKIKGALKTASGNIDKTEEFVTHLLGKDAVTGESKVLTLARNLGDKAKNGFKVNLVKELEKLTGSKLTEDLQGVYDYLQSSKLKAPGLQKPLETLKFIVKKGIEKGVPLK